MYLTAFDPFTGGRYNRLTRVAQGHGMPMDAARDENGVVFTFDVPGTDPDSIDVTVDRGVLSVTVQRQQEKTQDGKFFLRERTTGSATRRVYLSDKLDTETVDASYANGVLTVRIPVLEHAKARKIEIRQPDVQQELAS